MIGRSALATLLVTVALALLSVAYSAAVLRSLVFEPDTIADATDGVLASAPVRAAFADRIVDAIERDLFGVSYDELEQQFGFDARRSAERVADATVASRAFRDAVHDSLVELHGHIFDDRTGPIVIDATAVTEAARAAAVAEAPELAAVLPPGNELQVTIPVDSTPRLGWLEDKVDATLRLTGLAALVAAGTAFTIHAKRHRVLASLGGGLILIAAGHLLISVVLPEVLDQRYTRIDDVPVARPLGDAIADHVRAPALLLAAMGVVLIVAAVVWKTMAPRRRPAAGGWYADDPRDHPWR